METLNIAYDKILVFNSDGSPRIPAANISDYDIHPWHVVTDDRLKKLASELNIKFPYYLTDIEGDAFNFSLGKLTSLDFASAFNGSLNYNNYQLDNLVDTDLKFIYPIILFDNGLFEKYDTIELNPKLIECLKKGTAKLCFIQHTEGFFGMTDNEIVWVYNLCKKYGLNSSNVKFITSNFKSADRYQELVKLNIIEDLYEIIPFSFFGYNVWFDNIGTISNQTKVDRIREKRFNTFLENNRKNKKKYHFLCFNRIVKPHRVAVFSQLVSDKDLSKKSIISMGGISDENSFYDYIQLTISNDYKFSKDNLLEFTKKYDNTQHFVYDYDDLENNKANALNIAAHSNSFVNIVTESLFNPRSIFFSEKTYKPIYTLQPFILFGNPNSLQKLKQMGFKTFSNWWDENYDTELDFTKKLEKIMDVVYTIAGWSIDELYSKTQEMEEVLVHNYNNMLNYKNFDILFDKLLK